MSPQPGGLLARSRPLDKRHIQTIEGIAYLLSLMLAGVALWWVSRRAA